MNIKKYILLSIFITTVCIHLKPIISYAESVGAQGTCDFKNPRTNSIDKRRISGAQCSEWQKFWCLVDKEVGAEGWKCKAILKLTSEKDKEEIKTQYLQELIRYTITDPRFNNRVEKCKGFNKAQDVCATAGNFEKCMEIKWSKEYKSLRSTCE